MEILTLNGNNADEGVRVINAKRIKVSLIALLLVLLMIFIAGCGGGGSKPSVKPGSLSFTFDLSELAKPAARMALGSSNPTISGVTVTLSRTGYDSIVAELTVTNNVASGQVDNLAPGYWTVAVSVRDGNTVIFTGQSDVNVVAGAVTQCAILLEPVVETPTTGGIRIVVGVNPLPGYKPFSQAVSGMLVDSARAKLYVLDSTTSQIGVYNADTLARERDLSLPGAPLSVAFNSDRTRIFLGYSTGAIYSLDVASGALAPVGDVLMEARHMVSFGDKFLMVTDANDWPSLFRALDTSTGQVVSTNSQTYASADSLEWNAATNTVYFHDLWISPADLYRLRVNPSTGQILRSAGSIYHGDYALGTPIRVIKNGSRLVTSSGSIFLCSTEDTSDLIYSGNLGYRYTDLASEDGAGYLYALGNDAIKKLLVIKTSDLFLKATVDLQGTPKRVFYTANSILVVVEHQGRTYAKVWAKDGLGL